MTSGERQRESDSPGWTGPTVFRTQSCDGGYYDYILVSPDWTWDKYYLLCGDYNKYTPFTLTSHDNFLSIYFRSSVVESYRGFECRSSSDNLSLSQTMISSL